MAKKLEILPEDVLNGINAVISVNVNEPGFSSQDKVKLSGKEVGDAIYKSLVKELNRFVNSLDDNEKKIIKTNIVNNAKIRQAADVARLAKKKSVSSSKPQDLPSKLHDCSLAGKSEYAELYISEGDSACGSILAARWGDMQAVLPVRGKILNVMKLDLKNKRDQKRFSENAEIDSIIKAVGTGIGDHCDPEKSRYGKVIFACFTEDTEVFMLDGTKKTFRELVDMEKENPGQDYWVYSVDENGSFVPGRAYNPRVTSHTDKIVHVILDNGQEIKCTPDHLFMNREGKWIEAKDLTHGTSLMPMYFKQNENKGYNYGRQMYLDNNTGKWEFTHHTVFDSLNEYKRTGWHRHHIDGNFLNNEPSNLIQVDGKAHKAMHGRETLTRYNKSEAHRKKTAEIGRIYGPENMTRHNKSEKHRKVAAEIGKIYGPKHLTEYNQSEKHREMVKNINQNDDIKRLQKRGRAESIMSAMIQKDFELSEEGYKGFRSKYHVNGVSKDFDKLTSCFDEGEDLYELSKDHDPIKLVESGEGKKPDMKKGLRSKVARIANEIMLDGKELNEENYMEYRGKRDPKWDFIFENGLFETVEEILEFAETSNHMVDRIWIEDVPTTPMYDFTVDTYHNFVTPAGEDSGVVVHQCDGDVDGGSINVLLLGLFYKLFRPMIEAGMIYQCVTPFFEIKYREKGEEKTEYAADEKERIAIQKKLDKKKIKYVVSRAKGLGELDADVFHDYVLDPRKRRLIQIKIGDAEEADEMINLAIGSGSPDDRKKWMIDHKEVIEDLGLYE